MLVIRNILKTYGDKRVLNNITLSLKNEIVALVGDNGAGKSTLFEIIAGKLTPDEGSISADGFVAYLPQNMASEAYNISDFLNINRNTYKNDAILKQLGLGYLDLEMGISALSGGEKTKLGFAQILLSDPTPTILLLDEPTNNLDLEGILWLEKYIVDFNGTVFIASHDRALIDKLATGVIELSQGEIKKYGGNYSSYLKQKKVEMIAYERKFNNQEKMIGKIEDNINSIKIKALQGENIFSSRNPYQRRKIKKAAKQAVARRKKLDKFLTSINRLEKPVERRDYPFYFFGDIPSDKFILGMRDVVMNYADKRILDMVTFSVYGSSHAWLAGINGSGKSTILKLLTGQLEPDSGKVEIGSGINIGYFSQELIIGGENITMYDYLVSMGAGKTDIFKYAKYLHMENQEVSKPLSSLSRGQLTKIEFIKLLMGNNDILILDEPTNHLETDTREQLEDALKQYKGAILIASHDRYFLEAIRVDKELEIKSGTVYAK